MAGAVARVSAGATKPTGARQVFDRTGREFDQVVAMLVRAGVTLTGSRDGARGLLPGRSRAQVTIFYLARRHGVRVVERALRALVIAAGDRRDQLKRTMIAGAVLAARRSYATQAELIGALRQHDCDGWMAIARARAVQSNMTRADALALEIIKHLPREGD